MAEQYTNIENIYSRILRHPLMKDVTFEYVVDLTVDFMRIVGVPDMFEEKVTVIDIDDYRGLLPCDYYNVIQIRDIKTNKCYIHASDSFHYSNSKSDTAMLTYKIQNSVIFTNTRKATLEMAYHAIMIDENGYPMIPDNSSFTRALTAYIKKEYFTIQFDMGNITPNVLQQALQDYAWAVGACETEFNRLSIDKAESLFNNMRTLIDNVRQHGTGFENLNKPEFLRKH